MDEDGLPIVGPGVNYFQVQSISQKRQLSFLNHFILYTVRFLNKFSGDCEEKLEALNVKIQKIETCLAILEAKLASIPGLDDIKAPAAQAETSQSNGVQPSAETTATAALEQAHQAPPQTAPPPPEPEPVEEKTNAMPISQHPSYAKYFKMLNVGVPPPAIKLKMSAEGLDPDMLDTPDAPAPEIESKPAQDSDSDDSESSFSD